MLKLFVTLLALSLAACGISKAPATPELGFGGSASKMSFIALGDTGCGAEPPCSSAGEAGGVAKVVEKVCAMRGCDFALLAGDNIYEQGAVATSDPSFASAFRTPYANLHFPFLVALGNHDNSNSLAGEGTAHVKGDVQVDYAASADNIDKKWVMPDRYYRYALPAGSSSPLMEFFVIDASPITHFGDDPNPQWSGATLATYNAGQTSFFQDALAGSKARWKFALAHHPYISNGQHGNAGSFEIGANPDACSLPVSSSTCRGAAYKSFLENTICNKADVFFTGHDHEMYWLMPTAACGKTEFILSGNGSKERTSQDKMRNPVFYQADETYGFVWVQVEGDTMTAAVYRVGAGGVATDKDAAGNPVPAYQRSFARQP